MKKLSKESFALVTQRWDCLRRCLLDSIWNALGLQTSHLTFVDLALIWSIKLVLVTI